MRQGKLRRLAHFCSVIKNARQVATLSLASVFLLHSSQGLCQGNPGRYFLNLNSKSPAGAIRVNLLGGVRQPGQYFVPIKTHLIDVLTLAGGVLPNFDVDNISIKRVGGSSAEIIQVNLSEVLSDKHAPPLYLTESDTVFIPEKEPLVDRDTSGLISLVASLLSLTLTTLVLRDKIKQGEL